MFQVAALPELVIDSQSWISFASCETPVWDPVCYTQSMSLKSFDYSLFTNLSSRQLFRGMLHGYEFILSRIISRTILRHTPCTCNDYLLNTSQLLDCTYLLSANPFAKKSHLKKGWKATASGSHLFHSKFWYLPPLLGVRRNGEGWEREKKGNIGKDFTREWRAKNCETALSDFKESHLCGCTYTQSSTSICLYIVLLRHGHMQLKQKLYITCKKCSTYNSWR